MDHGCRNPCMDVHMCVWKGVGWRGRGRYNKFTDQPHFFTSQHRRTRTTAELNFYSKFIDQNRFTDPFNQLQTNFAILIQKKKMRVKHPLPQYLRPCIYYSGLSSDTYCVTNNRAVLFKPSTCSSLVDCQAGAYLPGVGVSHPPSIITILSGKV